MQDGDVDVYIVLDDKANAPESEEYTALLTVEDQNSSTDVGAAGYATLTHSGDTSEQLNVVSN